MRRLGDLLEVVHSALERHSAHHRQPVGSEVVIGGEDQDDRPTRPYGGGGSWIAGPQTGAGRGGG